jgi:omega-6 fatty acid desaturase (delta-12 desaturase)
LTAGAHVLLFAACAALPWWPARLLAALLDGWMIFILLCIGHDAAHGNVSRSARVNRLISRLAFLPSLTPYSVWVHTHNRLHHGFTNLRGHDWAYTPFSREEFDRLPAWRRALERCYKTVPGLALYYIIEIWWKHVFFYPARGSRERARYALDRLLVVDFAAAQVGGLLAWQFLATPAGAAPSLACCACLLAAVVLPWLAFCWFIGLVSFLQHTHPNVRWYANKSEWSFYGGNVQGSVHVVFPWPLDCFMHVIMEHTAHHADSRVATARLREYQQQLEDAYADVVVERFSLAYLRRMLATCQLYDYDNHRWLTFAGHPTKPRPTPARGEGLTCR